MVSQPTLALIDRTEPSLTKRKKVKPYTRGKLSSAVAALRKGPEACAEGLRAKVWSDTSDGPINSREKTWAILAREAGYSDPFHVTCEMIFAVMGALDAGGYRSTELYLDTARQQHISRGYDWTQQLALSAKRATRACKRGRGPSKQAQPLPLAKVPSVSSQSGAVHPGGPCHPARAILLVSWWLLREIEASNAEISHVTIDKDHRLAHWRLPHSKADWVALGATRTHSCTCSSTSTSDPLCPFHAIVAQIVDTFSFLQAEGPNPRSWGGWRRSSGLHFSWENRWSRQRGQIALPDTPDELRVQFILHKRKWNYGVSNSSDDGVRMPSSCTSDKPHCHSFTCSHRKPQYTPHWPTPKRNWQQSSHRLSPHGICWRTNQLRHNRCSVWSIAKLPQAQRLSKLHQLQTCLWSTGGTWEKSIELPHKVHTFSTTCGTHLAIGTSQGTRQTTNW